MRTEAAPAPPGRPDRRRAAALLLLCVVVYNANLRHTPAFDTLPASLLPFALWRGDGLHLDRFVPDLPPDVTYGIVRSRAGGLVSIYPVVTPLLVSPLYLPSVLRPELSAEHPKWGLLTVLLAEKLAASLVTGLAVAFFYLALRRRLARRPATGLALLLAFATPLWSISSQGLWQHGTAQLILSIALCLLADPAPPGGRRITALGLFAGLLVANRPQDAFLAAGLGAMALHRAGRRSGPFWVAAACALAPFLLYNHHHFGSLVGGYGSMEMPTGAPLRSALGLPKLEPLLGLWLSNRGLLFFCPFLAWIVLSWRRAGAARYALAPETVIGAAAVLATSVFYSGFTGWSAGHTYGPRYMSDALPVLVAAMAPAVAGMRGRAGRFLFGAAALWGVALQAIGAFSYPAGHSADDRLGFWSLARSAPVLALRAGPATPHFLAVVTPRSVGLRAPLPPAETRAASVSWSVAPPSAVEPLEPIRVRVVLTREGRLALSSLGSTMGYHAVRWLVRWEPLDSSGEAFGWDAWLGLRAPPGEALGKTLHLVSPRVPGRYRLAIEPGQLEGPTWTGFSASGARRAEALVHVGRAPGPDPAGAGETGPGPGP